MGRSSSSVKLRHAVDAVPRPASQYALYGLGLLALRRDDVLLASFLRSGNTWARLFLCNLISLREWDGRPVTYGLLEATMPRLGHDNLFRPWPHPTMPRVVKTHRPYSRLFGRTQAIGIVRDPRDVMVSSYHF